MAYLTHEWEQKQLMKKSGEALYEEGKYLWDQLKIKCKMLDLWGFRMFAAMEPDITFEMIEADIKSISEQLERVANEVKRRELP